ncbi:cation:proton antiporter domain-containing protein [Trichothermofontia sp.]
MTLMALFVLLVFLYSLISARIERTIVTAPIVSTTAGLLVGWFLLNVKLQVIGLDLFLKLAEIGLVLLLFTDASRTGLRVLNNIRNLPVRLLSAGMLLTILLGSLGAMCLFPQLSFWEAGILGAILAPTDAGLGQIIVNSPRVPMKIRQALNVEAGLNDGLSVPFLLFLIAMTQKQGMHQSAHLTWFMVE